MEIIQYSIYLNFIVFFLIFVFLYSWNLESHSGKCENKKQFRPGFEKPLEKKSLKQCFNVVFYLNLRENANNKKWLNDFVPAFEKSLEKNHWSKISMSSFICSISFIESNQLLIYSKNIGHWVLKILAIQVWRKDKCSRLCNSLEADWSWRQTLCIPLTKRL